MHNYNEQIIKNGSGRMKRPPLAKNSKAEEVQFLRSSIPLCFCAHIPAPILFWCRYPLVCRYFVALLSGIYIGPCNKHFSKSKSNHTGPCSPNCGHFSEMPCWLSGSTPCLWWTTYPALREVQPKSQSSRRTPNPSRWNGPVSAHRTRVLSECSDPRSLRMRSKQSSWRWRKTLWAIPAFSKRSEYFKQDRVEK